MATADQLDPLAFAHRAKRALERRLYGEAYWDLRKRADSVVRLLPLFAPNSSGEPRQLFDLTLLAGAQTFPLLQALLGALGLDRLEPQPNDVLCVGETERQAAEELKALFDRHGSDKVGVHAYHLVYGALLARRQEIGALLEIGLGTNNEDVVSNMTAAGRPGASLRAFRDFLPSARIHGADCDRRILFEEERIRTFFVDQTDRASFAELEALEPFDIIIDDGLHAPNANLAVLLFGLRRIRPGGWIVIEDIPEAAIPLWKVVAALLPPQWKPMLIRTRTVFMFLVQRAA